MDGLELKEPTVLQPLERIHLATPDTSFKTVLDSCLASLVITWTDQCSTTKFLRSLTDSHIKHLLKWLRRNYPNFTLCQAIVQGDIIRREDGQYPPHFHADCMNYMDDPEFWRLVVDVEYNNTN